MSDKKGYVYIMSNKSNSCLYTGVTSDLHKRIYEHKQKLIDGFTENYNITKSVYYPIYDDMITAIEEEKRIKGGSRLKKIVLIKSINPAFADLYEKI